MNKTIISLTACVLVALGGILVFTKKSQKNENAFIIGTAAGYAPYVSMNAQGTLEGFDIDVSEALAQKLNKNLVIKDLGSMTPLIMALEEGSIDAIIWGMSITQERLNKFAVIHYQGKTITTNPLLFWQTVPFTIKNFSDLKGLTICVEPSSAQSAIITKYKDINFLNTDKIDDALLNIQYKKADAAFVDPAIAKKFKAKFPEIQIVEMPLNKEDQLQGIGIIMLKNNKAVNDVKSAIDKLKQEGVIQHLETKWKLE